MKSLCPETLLPREQVSVTELVRILDCAGIEHCKLDEDSVFVVGYASNVLLRIEPSSPTLMLIAYWNFGADIDEMTKAHFVNDLNLEGLMIQFGWTPQHNRLAGFYALDFGAGITPRQFLRAACRFAKM